MNNLKVEEGQLIIVKDTIEKIKELELTKKMIDEKQKEFKTELEKIMGENGITSYESNDKTLKITYTPETFSMNFDSTTFQKENPELYSKYLKETHRKGSVRITIRGDKNE